MLAPSKATQLRIGITLLALMAAASWLAGWWAAQPPDFAAFTAGPERKTAFFAYLRPLIAEENGKVAEERARLDELAAQQRHGWLERRRLAALARKYLEDPDGMSGEERMAELLLRVDVVPEALALAQAAKESGWGTARFAITGNNYFGQRCWTPGCGIMPGAREPGMRHEVAVYDTPQDSVASYLLNLNSHDDYAELRAYRAAMRARGQRPSSREMAALLAQYSERRQAYIEEVVSLIDVNKLEPLP